MKLKLGLALLTASLFLITGCNREANVISQNLSRDADSFKIKRRIVFFNGITDKNIMEIIGYCSIDKDVTDNQLEITCKVGPNQYKKHYFGLSDNTAYFVEQVDPAFASEFNYKVIFRPQTLIPDVTVQVTTHTPTPKVQVTETK